MEYLVTMTTHVPEGTPDAEVDRVKAREAAHSHELAAAGRLLRLWRPPLEPGEWRTLGLFDAADEGSLESVLHSMPLRVWRTDDIVALVPHANDPGASAVPSPSPPTRDGSSEFFTTFTVSAPDAPDRLFDEAQAGEATRTRELAALGFLQRLWALPGPGRALGLWRAHDTHEMHSIVESLPLRHWFSVRTTPLSPHPSDPASTGS